MGTEGNEKADQLAKLGGLSQNLVDTPTPKSFTFNRIYEAALERWTGDWIAYPHARQTKQFFLRPKPGISSNLMKLTRYKLGRIMKLITGHNNLNYHCFLRDGDEQESWNCRFCDSDRETFHHFVTVCPSLRGYRAQLFKNYNGPDLSGTWSVDDLVRFSYMSEIKEAINYYGYVRDMDGSSAGPVYSAQSSIDNSR